MLIDGKEYKVAVCVLFMPSEEEATLQTVETLLAGIEDGVTIIVLLNGGQGHSLGQLFSRHESIRYHESPVNLGVAGGRNFLLKTDDAASADIIMMLDNDVVPPVDYVRRMAEFLLRHEEAAVVGPVIADIRYITYTALKHYGEKGLFGNPIFKLKSEDIKKYTLAEFNPWRIYHIGAHSDFFFTYFSLRPKINNFINIIISIFGSYRNSDPFLKFNTKYHKLLIDGEDDILVSNVGGGTQTYRRSLIEEIGYYDERFNPFGYEDVEFSTRALKKGYRNYIDFNTWIYHGTDNRQKERDPLRLIENRYRCLTLYADSALSGSQRKLVMLKLLLFETVADVLSRRECVVERYRARLDGYRKALKILKGGSAAQSAE